MILPFILYITFIKVGRLKWAGHVRMDQQRPAKRIFNAKPNDKKKKASTEMGIWSGNDVKARWKETTKT
jgi:hypothetical protein